MGQTASTEGLAQQLPGEATDAQVKIEPWGSASIEASLKNQTWQN